MWDLWSLDLWCEHHYGKLWCAWAILWAREWSCSPVGFRLFDRHARRILCFMSLQAKLFLAIPMLRLFPFFVFHPPEVVGDWNGCKWYAVYSLICWALVLLFTHMASRGRLLMDSCDPLTLLWPWPTFCKQSRWPVSHERPKDKTWTTAICKKEMNKSIFFWKRNP